MSLFPEIDISAPEYEPEGKALSADRRRTLRRQSMLAQGLHPTGNGPILDGPFTCGDCCHFTSEYHGGGPRVWHKCNISRLGRSFSAASDVRKKWPACSKFEVAA